jgi:hypothetical protein
VPAVSTVVGVISDQKIISAFIDSRDPLDDLAVLFDRLSGNNNVADVDTARFAIDLRPLRRP